jgi:hypothetical protein
VGMLFFPRALTSLMAANFASSREPAEALKCENIFSSPATVDPLARIRLSAASGLFQRTPILPNEASLVTRYDDKYHIWATSLSHAARGVTEVYFNIPERISENETFLLLLENFRNNGLDVIQPNKAGLAVTIETGTTGKRDTFQVVSLRALKNPNTRKETLLAQENLPEDFFRFVFEGYKKRMEIDETTIARLREISREVEERTLLFVKTKESYTAKRPEENDLVYYQDARKLPANPLFAARVMGRLMPDHFTLEAGLSVVLSRSASEKLPLELFTGFEVSRPPEGVIAEVGRFFVDKPDASEALTSMRLIGVLGSLMQRQDVGKIVIEADAARARLFSRLGLKAVHKRTNFAGNTEYIMEGSPAAIAESATRVLLEQVTDTSHLPLKLSAAQKVPVYMPNKRYLNPDDSKTHATSLGGAYDITTVLASIRDLSSSRINDALKHRSAELLLQDAEELKNVPYNQLRELATYLLKNASSNEGMRSFFVKWLRTQGRDGLVHQIFPQIKVKEFCNTRLKDLRDRLIANRVAPAQALASLQNLMHENPDLVRVFKDEGLVKFAQKLLDAGNAEVAPFDVSEQVLLERTYDILREHQ